MITHLSCHGCGLVVPINEVPMAWVTDDYCVICPTCKILMWPESAQRAVAVTVLGPAPDVPMPEAFEAFCAALDLSGL